MLISNPIYKIVWYFILGIILSFVYIPVLYFFGTLLNAFFVRDETNFDKFRRIQVMVLWITFILSYFLLIFGVLALYHHLMWIRETLGVDTIGVMIILGVVALISVVFVVMIMKTLKKDENEAKGADGIPNDGNFSKYLSGKSISPLFEIMFQSYNSRNEQILGPMAESLKSIEESNQSFRKFFSYMRQNMVSNLESVWNGMESQYQGIQKMVQSLLNVILDTFYTFENAITSLHYIYDIIDPIVNEVVKAIEDITDIKKDFTELGDEIVGGFKKAGKEAEELAEKAERAAVGEAKKIIGGVEDEVKKITGSIGRFFKHPFGL